MYPTSRRVALFALLCAGAPACAQPAPSPPIADALLAPSSPPSPPHSVAHFTAHFDHTTRTLTINPSVPPSASTGAPQPQSVDPISIDQTGGPLPSPNTVDLISTNCIDSYPATPTFQCDVEVRSDYTRSLANLYVQVTSITLNGSQTSAYDATNSDAYNPLGLAPTFGLWGYTNASEDPNAISGVLTPLATGFNTGTRTWVFANPDDANWDSTIEVFASEGFSSYELSGPNPSLSGYVDACTGGTALGATSTTNISLPFDFTIFNTNTTAVNIASNGQVTFGLTPLAGSGTPVELPSTSAPRPAFFPFWDDIGETTGDAAAQVCFQTLGAAPNRQFLIEWRDFDFLNAPGGPNLGASLDFEVFLFEGTGEIDTVYNTMTGDAASEGRETGAFATVGLQDETGTVTTSEYEQEDYGAGNSWGYIPLP